MSDFKNSLLVLSQKDEKLKEIISLINPKYSFSKEDEFTSLVNIIIGQQLSNKVANTIRKKFEVIIGSKKFDPKSVLSKSEDDLRKCGMSKNKISYIKKFSDLMITNPSYFKNLKNKNEDDILLELIKIKGIGVWTASIFMMKTLNLENIYPYGDATLKKAINKIYGELIDLQTVINSWTPFKSHACRILWQWVDNGMPTNSNLTLRIE